MNSKNIKLFRIVVFCIFLSIVFSFLMTGVLFPIRAGAETIYVDNQLTNDCKGKYSIANRDCSGSDGDAYDTPQEAADVVNPGDIVYFRGGTYYRHDNLTDWATVLNIQKSGASDNPITFKNYNNEKVILSGMRPEMEGHLFTVILGKQPSEFQDISGQGVQNIIIDGGMTISVNKL